MVCVPLLPLQAVACATKIPLDDKVETFSWVDEVFFSCKKALERSVDTQYQLATAATLNNVYGAWFVRVRACLSFADVCATGSLEDLVMTALPYCVAVAGYLGVRGGEVSPLVSPPLPPSLLCAPPPFLPLLTRAQVPAGRGCPTAAARMTRRRCWALHCQA